MQKIIDGLTRFHKTSAPVYQPLLAHLAENGQKPQAMMITCADSRLMPEELTQVDPGDLFMIRNIGNLVPRPEDASSGTDVSVGAALDYALDVLHIRDLVVMGHSGCGAMAALMEWDGASDNIGTWLRNGRLALARLNSTQLTEAGLSETDRLSQINVLASLDNLSHYLSLRNKLQKGEVRLHGWWFNVAKAQVLAYDEEHERFVTTEKAYAKFALR